MTLNNNILVTLFIVTIASVHHVQSARILFISATPSPSHQKPFQQIWKALALRGHEMHVVTPNPLANNTIENLVQYNISEVYLLAAEFNKNHKQKVRFTLEKPSFLGTFSKELVLHKGWHFLFEYTFKLEEMQKLIKTKPKFDAVIVEWLFPTMAAFGAYFEAPLIGITSLGAPTNALDAIGNILNPVVSPDQNIPLRRELSFRDRLLSVLYSAYIRTLYHWVILPNEDKVAKQYLGKDLPYLGNIERNVSLLLLNRNQISHRIMSVVPGVIEFGGFDYPKVASVLSPELKRYLDNSKNGVVYFSLGAAIKMAEFLSTQQVEIFREVLGTLPYNVLWKWENTSMDNQPKNVYKSQWINQTAVLEHPNVKLFITQGGLQSTEEAIAAHKPIIGIPFHSDQTTNVDTCVKYGMGKMLDLEELSVEKLRSYILEIINDPSYAENAKKLDELMKDQPMDGLEKAIWWIEYVIRHKGARHLRSVAVDLPWWQYLMLDVIGFVSVVLFLIFLVLYLICRFIFRCLFGRIRRKKEGKKNKKD